MSLDAVAAPIAEVAVALRRAGIAEVDDSTRRRAEYSSDASLYRVTPGLVAFPRHTDEVVAALDVCRSLRVPLTVRGAGTSIAGNAIGRGVVLDVSRHLHRILDIDPDQRTAVVEPGVVLDQLQRAARPHGLRFGPDPSTHDRCTLGGMIGNNACGSRALGYGKTSDNVHQLDVVFGTGERQLVGLGPAPASPTLAALNAVVDMRLAPLRQELGRFSRQVSGYALHHLLPENGRDAARMLVGSEGTLALTLAATVRLVPQPPVAALVALGYSTMMEAADAVPVIVDQAGEGLTALEGLDARLVEMVASRRGGRASLPALPRGTGWLIAEVTANDATELRERLRRLVGASDALDTRNLGSPQSGAGLAVWTIREAGAGLAARPTAERRAHAGWEDSAVPPSRLGEYLRALEALMRSHSLTGIPYGHFGEGCVHIRIDFPFGDPASGLGDKVEDRGRRVYRAFMEDAADLVASFGGTLSGEHGDGRARSQLLPRMYSQEVIEAFAAVKRTLDPDNVLNPGIITDAAPLDADVRLSDVAPVSQGLSLLFDDDSRDFARAVHRCTGVGACRADRTSTGGVMCPSFLATKDEKDSTRGRSKVLAELARGTYGPPTPGSAAWGSTEVREALDLCLQCKGCSSDCPTGVDMAAYKSEVLHQAYAGRRRPLFHHVMSALPRWARMVSRVPRLGNALLHSPFSAAGKRLVGVDARRDLPRFAQETFRSWFAGRPQDSARDCAPQVLLWIDTFTDLFTPEVGVAAVSVLESAGYAVSIPTRPVCCGLTWMTMGKVDQARRHLAAAVAAIDEAAPDGAPVVGLEPSCVGMFRGDADHLLEDPRQRETAQRVRTLAELLLDTPGWSGPDLRGVEGVVQPHCHHHAVMGWEADAELLRASGADLERVGGCCGYAGSFGVQRGHYETSMAVAQTALAPAIAAADARAGHEVTLVADGFSCRTQVRDLLDDRRARHLAEVLADRLPPED